MPPAVNKLDAKEIAGGAGRRAKASTWLSLEELQPRLPPHRVLADDG